MANKDFVQLGAVEADDLTDASIWKTNFVVNGELTLFAGEHCYQRHSTLFLSYGRKPGGASCQ